MDERRAQDERFVADGPQRMAEARRRAAEGVPAPEGEPAPEELLRRIWRWFLNPFDDPYSDPEDYRRLWLAEGRRP